jgi:uncharacterized protein
VAFFVTPFFRRFAVAVAVLMLNLGQLTAHDAPPPAAAESKDAANEPASNARDVTFEGKNGVKLAGTLLIPDHKPGEKLPGVILVAGSGPTDRNGNSALLRVQIDLLKQIAELLAQEGITSLRYDKRGQYASEPLKEGDSLIDFVAWENYVGDAAAALAFLQSRPEIDPRRTAMIGHSEGGMLVLQAAVEGKLFRHPPAALVLASTPGRRIEIVLRHQISQNTLLKLLSKQSDEIMERAKATGELPEEINVLLRPIFPPYAGKLLQGMLNYDGADLAARVSGPVLVISGEKDTQHVVTEETAALASGLKKRPRDDHEVFIVPGASHNLKPVTSILDPGFAGAIAPEAAAKLRSWLIKQLQPKN